MQFSNSNIERDEILSRFFPHAALVASPQHNGLSGGSCVIAIGPQRLVLRQQHAATTPAPFLRQYRALKRLPNALAPRPRWLGQGWMAVDYLAGEVKTTLPEPHCLADLLYHLHQQPCFGWRITLLPLLERYWQACDPVRRTPRWLAWLKRLKREREPGAIRLAPLHMDVHAGNLVHTVSGLRLIDWEYAGDGDIALELASVWTEDEAERQRLIDAYAQAANIDFTQLSRQVRRWRPWVLMLMAGWYECRWQQTGAQQFITLANETWCQLETKG